MQSWAAYDSTECDGNSVEYKFLVLISTHEALFFNSL